MNACPPREELESLLANELSGPEEESLEAHVAGCTACQLRLDDLTRGALTLVRGASEGRLTLPAAAVQTDGGLRDTPLPIHPLTSGSSDDSSPRPLGGEGPGVRGQPSGVSLPHGRGLDGAPAGVPQLASLLQRVAGVQPAKVSPQPASLPPPAAMESPRLLSSGSAILRATGTFFRRQFWTWPLVAALFLGGAGWWVVQSVESAMRQQRVNELTTVLEADLAALHVWMGNQRTTAELIARDDQLRALTQELLALAQGKQDVERLLTQSKAQSVIRSRLAGPLRRAGYAGFVLVSPSGVVLAAEHDAPVGLTLTGYRWEFLGNVLRGEAAVSKPFLSPLLLADAHGELRANLPVMSAAACVRDQAGQTIAALDMRIRPEDEFTRILQVARSGDSGETYVFDRQGLLLSQSRFDEQLKQIGLLVDRPEIHSILTVELRDPAVNMVEGARPGIRRPDQPLTRMAKEAVLGKKGHDADGYRDYRGVPVVGAWRWLDEYDFGVATEIDVAEAFRPAYILRGAYAVLIILLVLSAAGVLAAMLWIARQRRALRQATVTAKQLGQYTLVERLGSGGMGTVYKARHALLRRPTAVKLLNVDQISGTAIARFEREVQLTSGLTHPNTVAIFDYGRTPEGIFYYAMEYLEGINLDDLVTRAGPLGEARLLYVLRQVCGSLAEAHAAGLVHRDIKPANIFLTCRGGLYDFVKVLDFGLVKALGGPERANLTSPHDVTGTPLYLSPEALSEPDRVDARADVYAIGAVGYFLFTGAPVFNGASVTEICLKHAQLAPEAPSARCGRQVSPELEQLLLSCLAKSPADRPADAADLLCRLEACAVDGRWTTADAAAWWAAHGAKVQTSVPASSNAALQADGLTVCAAVVFAQKGN